MSIEKRIRKTAATKVKVVITNKSRSKWGFIVRWPGGCEVVKTKAAARQMLLAKVRCQWAMSFEIVPVQKHKP
ncbi:MAG TPA: hypothetical protein VFC07_13065 [Verrucomicrobiae bacterium]|nr:hypothetical protein [Verrucomicrobiae bacterium]